jgi:F420-dependent hydroxymycolic acid dehydrogenase
VPSPETRFGFVLSHEQFPSPRLLELGEAAEAAGFDEVWTSDHFHPWQDNQGHAGHAWLTLAALGQRTKSIQFGTGITCPSFRYRPSIVAQAFATLAQLSPGRVFLGVGSGEALNEFPSGGGWAKPRERRARLVESIGLIRELWAGDWVNHLGRYYQVRNAKLYDPPPSPIPVYIAASGRRTARSAGALGDGWIVDAASLGNPRIRSSFDEGAREAGKDPASLRILVETYVVVGSSPEAEEAAALWRFVPIGLKDLLDEPDPRVIQRVAEQHLSLEDVYRNWIVGGDPWTHVAAVRQLLDAGATDIFVHSGQSDQQRVIDFYARDVLPRLR